MLHRVLTFTEDHNCFVLFRFVFGIFREPFPYFDVNRVHQTVPTLTPEHGVGRGGFRPYKSRIVRFQNGSNTTRGLGLEPSGSALTVNGRLLYSFPTWSKPTPGPVVFDTSVSSYLVD